MFLTVQILLALVIWGIFIGHGVTIIHTLTRKCRKIAAGTENILCTMLIGLGEKLPRSDVKNSA
jgi:predicted transporter